MRPHVKILVVLVSVLIMCTTGVFAQAPDSTLNVRIDTLNVKIDSLNNSLNVQKLKLNHKIDSLNHLNLPTEKYTRKLDSLNNIDPQKYLSKINKPISDVENKMNDVEKKVNDVENKINKPISNAENKINDKLNLMRNEGGADANIPGNLDTKLPLDNKLSLDKANLPNTDVTKNLDLKNPINTSIDNPLSDINKPSLDNINTPSLDEINGVKDKLGDVNQVTDKVQSYSGDVKNIDKTIENKAGNLSEIKDLQKQTAEIDKAKGMIGEDAMKEKNPLTGKTDPDALKSQAKQEITKQAVNHFKGQEQALKGAMDKLSKAKEKYSDVSSLKDLPKRPPNPMKGKPLIERIQPGITLQIMNSNHFMVDINPVVSYRFTGRINAGLGWNERVSFAKWNKLASSDRVYGPRVFGSFSFKKGFSAKAEIEKMNALVPASPLSPDGARQWLWSAFVGIKKDYKFMGTVRGNAQILYNLYDDHSNSPYFDRLVVRMGFEFPMKKPKKPQNQAGK